MSSFSVLGCSGGSINEVHRQDLLRRVKTAEAAKAKAESKLNSTLQDLEIAEDDLKIAEDGKVRLQSELNSARRRAKAAEAELNTVLRRAKESEDAKVKTQSELSRALQSLKKAEAELNTALRRAKAAEVDARPKIDKSERDNAHSRLRAAEAAKAKTESNLNTALRRVNAAEAAERRAISERDKARERAKIAEAEKKKLEQLVSLVPQVEIKDVRTDVKKKEMDISVIFSIKNRKDIKGWVYAYFYFQDGEKLENKKGKPIFIRKEFTPKSVTVETQPVKLSMPYDKLNTSQPSKLKFDVRIYDEPTESFLDKGPYTVSFSFYPNRDNPVRLTSR